jgi:hypothetical protein
VISQLQRLAATTGDRPLLITRQVPDSAIDQLIAHGLEFVDAAGNLYLNSNAYVPNCFWGNFPQPTVNRSLT